MFIEDAAAMGLNNTRFLCGDAGKIAGTLIREKIYPDLEFFHDYTREIDDEGAEYLLEEEGAAENISYMTEFVNIIKMDDENIEKFKIL